MRKVKEVLEFRVSEPARLDLFLSRAYPEFSRTYVKRLIEEGFVRVNGLNRKPSHRVKEGDIVLLEIPEPEPVEVKPENIPLEVLFEDEDIAVVIKPCGLVVHPSPGYTSGTLVNALLYHIKDLSSIGGIERPGIVHRLDKETMGLMVVAKNDRAHRNLVEQFAQRKTEKFYKALVVGLIREDHLVIEKPIGRDPVYRKKFSARSERGKPAKTELWVEERLPKLNLSLLRVKIYTGRTHQIRVHLSSIGHPVVGDRTYGFKKSSVPEKVLSLLGNCNMLLAYRLGLYHPTMGMWLSFQEERVSPFLEVLREVRDLESSLG